MKTKIIAFLLIIGCTPSYACCADGARYLEESSAGRNMGAGRSEEETAPLLESHPNPFSTPVVKASGFFGITTLTAGFCLVLTQIPSNSPCGRAGDDHSASSFAVTPTFIAGLALAVGGPALSILGCYLARCSNRESHEKK